MKKAHIVDHVVSTTSLSRAQASAAVDSVFEAMSKSLCRGESIFVRGFATIKALTVKAKKARNISKGISIDVPAYKSARLVLGDKLKSQMNNKWTN